jgi:hypothetical protein
VQWVIATNLDELDWALPINAENVNNEVSKWRNVLDCILILFSRVKYKNLFRIFNNKNFPQACSLAVFLKFLNPNRIFYKLLFIHEHKVIYSFSIRLQRSGPIFYATMPFSFASKS